MTYKTLHDRVESGISQWTANLRYSARQSMQYLAEAQTIFQNEARLMERTSTITIAANTNSAAYSFRWEPTQTRVRDDVNKIDYGVRGYDAFKMAEDFLNPTPNQQAKVSPVPPRSLIEPSNYVCTFFNRTLYVYPKPTADLVLTVHYIPLLPSFGADDPYWADWFSFTDTLAAPITNVATTATLTNTHDAGSLPCAMTITDGALTDTGTASVVNGAAITFSRVGTKHAFAAGASVTIENESQWQTMFTTLTPEREFFAYLSGFVEYAIEQYLAGVLSDKNAAARFRVANERWTMQLKMCKSHRQMKDHFVQATYIGPVTR